jgi:hypothetical protein
VQRIRSVAHSIIHKSEFHSDTEQDIDEADEAGPGYDISGGAA